MLGTSVNVRKYRTVHSAMYRLPLVCIRPVCMHSKSRSRQHAAPPPSMPVMRPHMLTHTSLPASACDQAANSSSGGAHFCCTGMRLQHYSKDLLHAARPCSKPLARFTLADGVEGGQPIHGGPTVEEMVCLDRLRHVYPSVMGVSNSTQYV